MPLRLTSQLVNLLKPHGQKGLLEGAMIHTLRALRRDSDLLLSTMDVFVKEPSLDWQVCPLLPSFAYITVLTWSQDMCTLNKRNLSCAITFSEAAIKIKIAGNAITHLSARRSSCCSKTRWSRRKTCGWRISKARVRFSSFRRDSRTCQSTVISWRVCRWLCAVCFVLLFSSDSVNTFLGFRFWWARFVVSQAEDCGGWEEASRISPNSTHAVNLRYYFVFNRRHFHSSPCLVPGYI